MSTKQLFALTALAAAVCSLLRTAFESWKYLEEHNLDALEGLTIACLLASAWFIVLITRIVFTRTKGKHEHTIAK